MSHSLAPPPLPVDDVPLGAFAGVRAFFGGIGFVVTTPRVWGWTLVPMLMMLLIGFSVFGVLLWGSVQLSDSWAGDGFGGWVLRVVLGLAAILSALVAALALAQPLSGFALEAIVRAQERALLGRASPAPPFLASLYEALRVSLVTLVIGIPILGLLMTVNFFFPPAAIVTVPLKVLVAGWLVAWNFVDYPLSLRRKGVRARLRWVWRHFEPFTAFGVSWALVLVVPGMVLVLLPMGVAGATRLVVEEERWMPPPLPLD